MQSDDEALFERFRTRGDAAALGELFDRAAPALLRLAVHLARDPADAEDLLQTTFLHAIEARDTWDRTRPLMPWLCGILHNRARAGRRRDERALDPVRLPMPATSDPVHAAESSEFDAAVDAAITALPEIYQPVLRLHLAYGHAPAEIAHALDRPAATVRSQLARGLELLRKSLPAGLVSSAALWLFSGRGLAAVKQTVLGHAVTTWPAVPLASALIVGAATVKKTMLMVALAIVAAGTWFAWPRPELRRPSTNVSAPATTAAMATLPHDEHAPAGVVPATERVAVQPPAAPRTGSLRIACRWADDGTQAGGVLLTVKPLAIRDGGLLERTTTTGTDGRVMVADLPPGKTMVSAERGGELPVGVVAGRVIDAELVIPVGVDVRGRVVDEHGAPVPTARVWLSGHRNNYCDGQYVTKVDAHGSFVLRSVEPERFVSADAPGRRAAVVQPVRGEIGGAIEVELVLRGEGVTLLGKVLDPNGTPVADACVFVGHRDYHVSWTPGMFGEHRPPIHLRTDRRGEFRADGLAAGSKTGLWVRAVDFCTWHEPLLQLEADGDTAVTARLQRGAVLVGTVRDEGGQPVASAYVAVCPKAWFNRSGVFGDITGPDWAESGAAAGPDGRYRISGITPGTLLLLATTEGRESRGEVAAIDGETVTWDPVLAETALQGRIVDERGEPLAGWEVSGTPPRGKGNRTSDTSDAGGRFRCRRLAQVPYVLDFFAAGDSERVRPACTLRGVVPGGDEVLVRIPDAAIPSAGIEGTLLDTDGQPPRHAQVHFTTAGLFYEPSAKVDPQTGRFRIGPLTSGLYRLQGSDGARRSAWGEPFALAAHETRDVGVIRMPAAGSIALTVRGPDGAPLHGADVDLEETFGWGETLLGGGKTEQGEARLADVAPGSYRVRISGRDLPEVYQSVVVAAGRETMMEMTVPASVKVRLLLAPVTEPAPIRLAFSWTRDGESFQRYVNRFEAKAELQWSLRLLPGSYEITITSETGMQEANRFVVAASDPPERVIPIRLP
jgi:RNA polymerase sigma-70 factor (ECF subfamily)